MKNTIVTLGVALILAGLVGLTVIYTGLFNVSALWEDPVLVRWVLNETRENSVSSRASSIEVPALHDAEQLEEGFRSFREMCAICHTPPEATDSPTAQGLNPQAPDLAKRALHMSKAELFWVIKNGIRMTGMPAWGPTHKDPELWSIVAFVKMLPEMSGADYKIMDQSAPQGHGHSGGGHGDDESEADHKDNAAGEEVDEHNDDGHGH